LSIEALIAEVRRRAEAQAEEADGRTPALVPASTQQIADPERRLGMRLPELLRRLYREVSNGGFGPGYRLMGVEGGFADDQGDTSVDLYECFRTSDPEDAAWSWPHSLLPFCHWGCAIYSCVDLATAEAEIVVWDPNGLDPGTGSSSGLRPHGRTLESWLAAWVEGCDLWEEMFPDTN
jgi:hypothetical protein